MFYLLNVESGQSFYILQNQVYGIGRKDCNFLILGDNSISRDHAYIKIVDNEVTLYDLGAKYGTTVNNIKLNNKESTKLLVGDSVHFGIKTSVFILFELKINVMCTALNPTQKTTLAEHITFLNGKLLENYRFECNILVSNKIITTMKVIYAVTHGLKIVKPAFIEKLVNCVKTNQPLPKYEEYRPPLDEKILNNNLDILSYNENRKILFKDKVFVFSNSDKKKIFMEMIELVGGKGTTFEEANILPLHIDGESGSTEYIIVQPSENDITEEITVILEHLKQVGKRTIPSVEIPLAILKSSTEKDCNPSFDRTSLLKTKEVIKTSAGVLAAETQHPSTQKTIPNSVDLQSIPESQFLAMVASTQKAIPETPETTNDGKKEQNGGGDALSCKMAHLGEEKMPASSNFNYETASENVEKIVVDKSKKRKAEDIDWFNTSSKKANTVSTSSLENSDENNPFSLRMLKKAPTIKLDANNPFGELQSIKRKSENPTVPHPKRRNSNCSDSNVSKSTAEESFFTSTFIERKVPFKPTITAGPWLSKKSIKEIKQPTELDKDMSDFIDSFRDSFVVKEVPMTRPRSQNTSSQAYTGCVSFKKFKKVQPLHPQSYVMVMDKVVFHADSDVSDSVSEQDLKKALPPPKTPSRRGRKFDF